MGVLVLINPKVTIGATDLTAWIREVAMELEADQVDSTTAGSSGWRTSLPGLKKGEVKLTLAQDYAAAALDSLLWGWFATNQAFTAKSTQAANGASNPEYQGTLTMTQHSPLVGKLGDLVEVSLTLPTSGAITRAVA
jgi:predicted secreted protein